MLNAEYYSTEADETLFGWLKASMDAKLHNALPTHHSVGA